MAELGIAAEVKPPSFDPLKTLAEVTSLKRGLLENKVLGQSVGGKIALGRAITSATDPNTGETDFEKAAGLLAKDPEGSFALPEFSAQVLDRRLKEMNITQEQVTTTKAKLGPASDLALSLISNEKQMPLTAQNVASAIKSNLFDTGILNPQDPHDIKMASGIVGQLATGEDPSALAHNKVVLGRLYTQLHATTEGLNALHGAPQIVDTGSNLLPTRVSPATGEVATGPAIQKGLSPGEAVAPDYETIDDKGVRHMVTKGQAAAAGLGNVGATPPSGIPVSPGAGKIEAVTGQAQASQQAYTQDVNDAGGFSQRMLGLSNAEKALAGAQTGKGGQALQDWRSLLNTIGVPLSDADKGKAVSFDLARKYLTDYANRRGAALGMGTDAAREMIHAANPSVDINKAAAQDILKVIRGLERMQNAQVAVAQANHVSSDQYANWRSSWNRSVDPQGFMADQLPAKERRTVYDAMSPGEKKRYASAVQAAVQAGYFTLDDLRK